MKIVFIKKRFINYFCLLLFISFVFFIICFYLTKPFSFAVDIDKNSFFNIDVDLTLNNITKSDEKKAYLTFDDGPTIKATGKILDVLKEENVKASFFVVGKHVKEHPELVNRAYNEGHYIANHGYSHNNKLLYKNMENFKTEIVSTDLEISKAINIENYCSHIFRFPNRFYVQYLY